MDAQARTRKIFKNRYVSIFARVENGKIPYKSDMSAVVNLSKEEEPVTVLLYEGSGKDKEISIESFVVNEYNLCNAILMDIFEEFIPKYGDKTNYHRIKCDEEVANYLIKTAKQSDDYAYSDGYLYDVNRNRTHYLNALRKVKDHHTISNDAIKANQCLEQIVEGASIKSLKSLIGCSLCFCGKDEELKGMEEAQPHGAFGKDENVDAKPMCKPGSDRRKIVGLIKHTYNKLKKQLASSVSKEDSYERFLKLHDFLANRLSDSIVSTNSYEITVSRNDTSFRIRLEENGKPSISFDNGSKVSNLKSAKMVCELIESYVA